MHGAFWWVTGGVRTIAGEVGVKVAALFFGVLGVAFLAVSIVVAALLGSAPGAMSFVLTYTGLLAMCTRAADMAQTEQTRTPNSTSNV
jgi:membrane protein implicated in regulation of membrane protease activity